MGRIVVNVKLELLSDTIFSSGNSAPGGEDIALRIDHTGRPFLPASTLKGLLRESLENYLDWLGEDTHLLNDLLGEQGRKSSESPRRLIISDLKPTKLSHDERAWSDLRSFTAMENGTVKPGGLRTAACLSHGLVFEGIIICQESDYLWVEDGLKGIQWVGLMRNRGFGRVRLTADKECALAPVPAVKNSCHIRYRIQAVTPVSIPWLSKSGVSFSEERNYTESRAYVPGSAIRGMVLSSLAQEEPDWFEENKATLLQQVYFHNALPMDGAHTVIPTPMGFYDQKNGTKPYSVLLKDVQPGHKRVSLGQFCYAENGAVHGSSPNMVASMRIRRGGERGMFTARAMAPGTVLEGYITLEDPGMAEMLSKAFRTYIWLGADRYAGSGLCQVCLLDASQPDTTLYSYGPNDQIPADLHMLLLSPMTMARNGEPVGIDEDELAKILGVKRVTLGRSATSITEAAGYNRTWGCSAPSVTMYEAGSIFTLHCSAAPSHQALMQAEHSGIGIRRNEGYGRVLFIQDFGEKFANQATAATQQAKEWESARLRRARYSWLLNNPLPAFLSHSQLGDIDTFCRAVIHGTKDMAELEEFFRHNMDDRRPRHGDGYKKLYPLLEKIWSTPIGETLQDDAYPDSMSERLRLICAWITLSRKEGQQR